MTYLDDSMTGHPAGKGRAVIMHHGDCLDVIATLPDCSVDAVVTDPPYGLAKTDPKHVEETFRRWVNGERDYLPGGRGFMGKEWDAFVPPVAVWDECLRVLKPGGHVLAFAGSRTVDLMTLGLRMAGFDIRDSLAWLYGSGFPKSMDVSKAIESHETHGKSNSRSLRQTELDGDGQAYQLAGRNNGIMGATRLYGRKKFTPATDAAREWEGWGTALKPAFEPIVMARKPFVGTVAANVLQHCTGALNIDATRIGAGQDYRDKCASVDGIDSSRNGHVYGKWTGARVDSAHESGRWPANVVLDESQAAAFEESRFFYVAKAPRPERPVVDGVAHPTVKPVSLMQWLVRLVTPPGGTVLEPFAGSGTTVEACMREGFKVIAIEREADYLPLIQARIDRERARQAAKADDRVPSLFDDEAS